MNSSISSSDRNPVSERWPGAGPWQRFVVVVTGTTLALLAGLLAVIYVLDPYDTGRPGLFAKAGVRPQGPRTAAASRGRDPAFNAAIFGNSHVQLLAPARLDALTGARFVSLIAPATRPREQLALLDWFIRHRPAPARAVVLGVDGNWCTDDPSLPVEKPFPFWLYDRSPVTYAAGLLRFDLIEEFPRRIGYLLHRNAERARPDGFWDYEANYLGLGYDRTPELRARLEEPRQTIPNNPAAVFPAAERLAGVLKALDDATRVVLLFPPVHGGSLPRRGSAEAVADSACKAAFVAVARQRPGVAVVDWRRDTPEARDSAQWFDHTHYRLPLAHKIEASIAATLRSLE